MWPDMREVAGIIDGHAEARSDLHHCVARSL
jgi:hypothetical protein